MAEYETDGNNALAPNDPYRDTYKPNFNVLDGGKSKNSADSDAKNSLMNAENSATANPISMINGGAGEARSAEQNQQFGPRFTGKGIPDGKKDKGKGNFRRKGPLVAIMTLLLGGGGLMAGSQTLAPFGIVNNLQDEFNSMRTVMNRRSNRLLRFQLDTSRYNSPTKATIFGRDKFDLSKKQIRQLHSKGIIAVDVNGVPIIDADGNFQASRRKTTALRFDDANGNMRFAVPDAARPPNASRLGASADDIISLDTAFADSGFRNSYETSSKTWRGHITGWFDNLVTRFLKLFGITRSRYKGASADMDKAEFTSKSSGTDLEDGGDIRDDRRRPETDDNGDPIDSGDQTPGGEANPDPDPTTTSDADAIRPGDSDVEIGNKLTARARAAAKVTGAISGIVEGGCAMLNVLGVVSGAVAGYNAMQLLQYITGLLESISKTMSGDGAESPMSHYMTALTTNDESGKSGMQGLAPAFDGNPVNASDPTVKKFDALGSLSSAFMAASVSIASFRSCSYGRIVAQGVSTIISFIPGIGQGFKLVDFLLSFALGAAIESLISLVMPGIVNVAIEVFGRPAITTLLGPQLGTAALDAANMYMSSNHRTGGGSLGNFNKVLAYHRETETVIAEQAEYERSVRSPFDATSPYTFLGSIVNKTIPMMSNISSPSLVSTVGQIGGLVSSSLTSLMPSVSAAAEEVEFINSVRTDCPFLKDINAVGDAFCNPYIVSDTDTIGTDPAEIVDRIDDDNLDGEVGVTENAPIKPGSELSRYIVACGTRQSTFGTADGGLAANLSKLDDWQNMTGNDVVDGVVRNGVNALPGAEITEILAGIDQLTLEPWITGEKCVAGEGGWDTTRNYQRYLEDQRLAENMGIIEESNVTAFLDDFYEQNPLDNSETGILARYMGTTKEEAELALGTIEYLQFLAQYDPTDLYPMLAEPEKEISLADEIEDVIIADHYTLPVPQFIIYADTRYRNFAV